MRPFPARLDDDVYEELKKRSAGERKSMNVILNEALERDFRGRSNARAALLAALAALDAFERSET
jgi:hypothetical protein